MIWLHQTDRRMSRWVIFIGTVQRTLAHRVCPKHLPSLLALQGWWCCIASLSNKVFTHQRAIKVGAVVQSHCTFENDSFYMHVLLNTDPIKHNRYWLIFDFFFFSSQCLCGCGSVGIKSSEPDASSHCRHHPLGYRRGRSWSRAEESCELWGSSPPLFADYPLLLPFILTTMATHAVPEGCDALATICSGADLEGCLVPPSDFNAVLGLVLSTVLTIMLAMIMFSMGCTVEATKLWGHIKRPWGIFIGFLCQFGIMPFTAFALSLAFNVLPVQAIVIVIMGCCPGGTGSNIICYWLDGDMDLRWGTSWLTVLLDAWKLPSYLKKNKSTWCADWQERRIVALSLKEDFEHNTVTHFITMFLWVVSDKKDYKKLPFDHLKTVNVSVFTLNMCLRQNNTKWTPCWQLRWGIFR